RRHMNLHLSRGDEPKQQNRRDRREKGRKRSNPQRIVILFPHGPRPPALSLHKSVGGYGLAVKGAQQGNCDKRRPCSTCRYPILLFSSGNPPSQPRSRPSSPMA